MSGIAGIFNRNSEPVTPELLERMTSIVSYRGPDGINYWIKGPVGLSQLLLSNTAESVEEHSPMYDDTSGLCIIFDGRVDNREELSSTLKSHGLVCRTVTDMELVLKSYELWGMACAEKILGDFVFAIWDQRKQQLYCARDIMGVRPFYYSLASGHFIFGSEIRQLFQHPSVSHEENLGMAAEYLTANIQNFDETLYREIMRLPPAHYLLVDKNRIQIKQYWQPDLESSLHYSRGSDYVEHYLELFQKSVKSRLRCSGKVGATMSGGLDSTSVVGMAQNIYADQGSRKSISTFSITFPGRECDEANAIRKMIEMWNLDAFIYPFTAFDKDPGWRDQSRNSLEPPDSPLITIQEPLLKEARARQVKVLLSGTGADGILGGSEYPYWQALNDFELSFMLEHFHHQGSEYGWKYASSRLFRSLAWPLLPAQLRKFLLSLKPIGQRHHFLQPEFVSTSKLKDRLANVQCAWQYQDLAKLQLQRTLFNAGQLFFMESEEKAYAKSGIEQRHPFFDRRLLEFAVSVPDFQHLKNGHRKFLILEGSKKLLPESLQKSENCGHFSNVFQEMLKMPFVKTLLKSMELSRTGWVSQEKVNTIYTEVVKKSGYSLEIDDKDYSRLLPLIMINLLEVWSKEKDS